MIAPSWPRIGESERDREDRCVLSITDGLHVINGLASLDPGHHGSGFGPLIFGYQEVGGLTDDLLARLAAL